MKIIHLANYNSTNVGNGALINGLLSELGCLYQDAEITEEPWDDYTFGLRRFDTHFVRRCNEHDVLLINGAVAINGREYLKETGNRFELPIELCERLRCRVVFAGISYRVWNDQFFHNLESFRDFINYILSKPSQFKLGLRRDGTLGWIERILGIDLEKAPNVSEVPDTALFYKIDDKVLLARRRNRMTIAIAVNNEDKYYRYKGESRLRLVEGLSFVCKELIKRYRCDIVMPVHYFDDTELINNIIERLPPQLLHQHIRIKGMGQAIDPDLFYSEYCDIDVMIGMRVHSISPCIAVGTPVIALSTQDRISTFMSQEGLTDYCIDVCRSDFSEIVVDKVAEVTEQRAYLRETYKSVVQRNQLIVRNFIKESIEK